MKKIKAVAVAAAAFAALSVAAVPASAAGPGDKGWGDESTCSSPAWGGTYLCGGAYGGGTTTYYFRDGGQEVFVVGTDHAVWTRWSDKSGHKSGWVSMGGYLVGPVDILASDTGGGNFEIAATGADGRLWGRVRSAGNSWSAWAAV
ncbi:hypothetical protein [Kitasatospora sp. NPDC093558]|uniref:hypothetical protein n=1 Tax=Kitasatospora sp. NPDC093558 TaxID=3155201 RepID=UPI0034266716